MFFYLERHEDHSVEVKEATITYDLGSYQCGSHYALIAGKGGEPVHIFGNKEKAVDTKKMIDRLVQKHRREGVN